MDKTRFTEFILATGILSLFFFGMFGAFGAIVRYLFLINRDQETFSLRTMIAYAIMGLAVGIPTVELTEQILGSTSFGLVLLAGFLFIRILEVVDKDGLSFLTKILTLRK